MRGVQFSLTFFFLKKKLQFTLKMRAKDFDTYYPTSLSHTHFSLPRKKKVHVYCQVDGGRRIALPSESFFFLHKKARRVIVSKNGQ